MGNTTSGSTSGASIGDTTLTTGPSTSGVVVGDTSLNNGSASESSSNSGGNSLANESASNSSNGDQSMSSVNGASADGSGNSQVNIDTSDRSSSSFRSVALAPPMIQTAAPSFAASGNMVFVSSVCGPRVEKRSERVTGVLGKARIDLGADDDVQPAAEPYRYWVSPTGSHHVFGHQTVTYASSNGVASSKAFGLGGNNSGLAGGQFGASANSAASRTVLRIVVQECELPTHANQVQVLEPREARG